jgi:hypothetical protein
VQVLRVLDPPAQVRPVRIGAEDVLVDVERHPVAPVADGVGVELVVVLYCEGGGGGDLLQGLEHQAGAPRQILVGRCLSSENEELVFAPILRRTLGNNLLLMILLFIPLMLGVHELYSWSREEVRATDALVQDKAAYLNLPFFYVRAAIYAVVWAFLGWWFLRISRRQDETRDPQLSRTMSRASAPGLIFFALTLTFFAFDWIMSIDSHWYSTMFGVYYFAGAVVAFYCMLILLVSWLRKTGHLQNSVNIEHYHDMGKLLFGHNIFWAYIAFSQFMLIWYANIPEGTYFFLIRSEGAWKTVSLMLPWLHFAVPFLFLMSHNVKRRPILLGAAAVWLLVMCYIDVYWLVQPYFHRSGPSFGLSDIGAILTVGGFFMFYFMHNLRQANLIPVGDPRLKQSLSYDNGVPK